MVTIVATVTVQAGREEEWEAVWRQFRALQAQHPGFRGARLLAGDTLHIFGHDHLGPDLTQRLANGHHKVLAAL
jgi:heme-degrading monooxygenase HmoA